MRITREISIYIYRYIYITIQDIEICRKILHNHQNDIIILSKLSFFLHTYIYIYIDFLKEYEIYLVFYQYFF